MKKLLLLSLLLFLVSCSSEGPMVPTFTEIPEATSTPDATSTPVASETPLPSPTPTSEPDFSRVTSECLELLDHVPDDVNLPGALVFTEYLLNLETGEEIQLWEDYKFPKVSTDRDKMAVSLQKNQIQFFNGAGNQLTSVYIPGEDWLLPAYWINSNSIVLFKDYPIGGSGWGAYSDYSAILNIDTSDFIEIPKETYPDFHPHAMGNYWNSTKSVIGPNGRYVVYATSYSDIPPYDFMVLWDLEKNTEVARFDGLPYSTTPQWAPDGEYFLTTMNWEPFVTEEDLPYVGGNELVQINTSGEIDRFTYLTTFSEVGEYDFVWSPAGDKVAFLIGPTVPKGPFHLAVLDVNSGRVINYCVEGENGPVWSPDGKYLAITISLQGNDFYYDVVVIDIENSAIYLVKETAGWLLGWMNVPEE